MKFSLKFLSLTLSILTFIGVMTVSASAGADDAIVSPALSIIAKNVEVVVTGTSLKDASFSPVDFDRTLGCTVDSVTVLTLPSEEAGVLMLDGEAVTIGKTISRKHLSELTFESSGGCSDAEFNVTTDGKTVIGCHVMVIDKANLSPVTASDSVSIETMRGVSVHGSLTARDPEGGEVTYFITKAPRKGHLSVSGESFTYTPYSGKKGKDSFTVCARDEYGAWSDPVTVNVKIGKNQSHITYSDLDGHWAYAAAVKMSNSGIMSGSFVNGNAYFNPDEQVSREDFVTMLMKTIGLGDIDDVSGVGFLDDDEISDYAKKYCHAAYKLGFISGVPADGGVNFNPKSTITRAEVAVILENIIGAEVDGALPVFADGDTIPAWAFKSVCAMKQLGIMNGTGGGSFSPYSLLTRAEVASILSSVSELVK